MTENAEFYKNLKYQNKVMNEVLLKDNYMIHLLFVFVGWGIVVVVFHTYFFCY